MATTEKLDRVYNARRRLRKRPRDVYLEDIAKQTGLKLQWLSSFSRGLYLNPHEKNLVALEEYFKSQAV